MRFEAWTLWVALLALGCDGTNTGTGGDGGGGGVGGSGGAGGAGGAGVCGDGVTDVGEACDGGSIACVALGSSWSAGTAPCRASCAGWDVSACTLDTQGATEVVKPAERDPSRWAEARCNDGSPFAFRISLAPTPSPIWVIQLEGGGYCDDATKPCAERDSYLTKTLPANDGATAVLVTQGIFSRDAVTNPTFAGANHVLAH